MSKYFMEVLSKGEPACQHQLTEKESPNLQCCQQNTAVDVFDEGTEAINLSIAKYEI